MKIDEIKSIKQTTNEQEVNKYLKEGYQIVKIFSTKVKVEDVEEVKPCYVLGLVIV